jgi:hypothetical protein
MWIVKSYINIAFNYQRFNHSINQKVGNNKNWKFFSNEGHYYLNKIGINYLI